MSNASNTVTLFETLWAELGGAPATLSTLSIDGPTEILPSVYPVTSFAAATVGLATLAVAEWFALRSGDPLAAVSVDRSHAAIAFRSERYLERPALAWPPLWDPIAGDYATRDGFIRLHTNYPHHRAAAERVLGADQNRDQVRASVARMEAATLEAAIVAEGGCAAMMHTRQEWSRHPQGKIISRSPTIEREISDSRATPRPQTTRAEPDSKRPLAGVRVLDLTRVIAGPTCTRVLAAWGADVLRIDPVGFEDPDLLIADTTVGKRCAALDLRDGDGRRRFEQLLAEADVLVHGYRSDALADLGYDSATVRSRNAALVVAALDAYGFDGPWRARRGFDSLVQMSCGIAERGRAVFGTDVPKPLPAQALDHGGGYLLAATVCRSLCDTATGQRAIDARLSLAGTAKALMAMGETGDPETPEPSPDVVEAFHVEETGVFGRIRRVACPGRIGEAVPHWTRPAGRIGSDEPRWSDGESRP